ncbi:MAG TPA: YARHG domain-containing protein, partial [Myxococcaceae bacterium]|nr:YARHG domain-containing protein [Myxococcaceae bacterium]
NAALIAQAELSFRYVDLERKRDTLLAKAGKSWGDLPYYVEVHEGDDEDEDEDEGEDEEKVKVKVTVKETVYGCTLDDYRGSLPTKVTEEVFRYGETFEEEVDAAWVVAFKQAVAASKDCTYHGVSRSETNEASEPDLSRLSAEDRIELGLISRAMGDFATDSGQLAKNEGSLDAVLSVTELRQLSLRDLRLLRNTIYARRGRPFKSKLLQEHFARMPWYKPNPAYTDKRLTKNDQRNVALISQVEKEFGGALVDKDFQAANPSTSTDVDPPIPYEGTA